MFRLGCVGCLRTIPRLETLRQVPIPQCIRSFVSFSSRRGLASFGCASQQVEAVSVPRGHAKQQIDSLQPRPSTSSATRRRPLAARKPDLVLTRPASLEKPFFQSLLNYMADFPDALLLCKVGQFYESYFDQAIEIAGLLKITLTGKNMEGNRYPMCGIPVTQLDKYLEKLVREHNRFVAICEEHKHYDAEGNFRYMTRKVARVVTPGTLVDESFIEKQRHNYLLAVDLPDPSSEAVELAWIDTSTGEFYTQGTTTSSRTFQEDIARVMPSEVVLPEWLKLPEHREHPVMRIISELEGSPRVSHPRKEAIEAVDRSDTSSFSAIPLLSAYIRQTLLGNSPDLAHPLRVRATNDMRIDHVSLRALEIKQNNEGGRTGTLLSVLDRTVTSAGQRLLGDRITAPSKSISEINARLSLLSYFKNNGYLRDQLIDRLHQLDDEARLMQKMSIGRPTAEDLLAIARAIRVQGEIKTILESHLADSSLPVSEDSEMARNTADGLTRHEALAEEIESSVDMGALEAQRAREHAAEEQLRVPPSASNDGLYAGAQMQDLEGSEAGQSRDVDEEETEQDSQEDEGLDPWNIPLSAISPKAKAAKAAKAAAVQKAARAAKLKADKAKIAAETAKEAPSLRTKSTAKTPVEPINWGKIEMTVMQPDSSPVMSGIYDEIDDVETRAKRLHRTLLRQIGALAGDLTLRVVPRHGAVVRVTLKRAGTPAVRDLEEKGTLTMVTKLTTHKVYSYTPWVKLNSEMQGLLVRLKEAESFAVRQLCNKVLEHWEPLRRNAAITAELDVATSLAKAAIDMGFTRPDVHEEKSIEIKNGRHPVAEHELKKGGRLFEANDTLLNDDCRLHVVTGPNMGGKSTVLRAVGIIAAMAQAGSFVPAEKASIGIVDQLFARIRYSDNIAHGRSSFRVEMDDAAYILENATDRSLVLLDEFGRGTTADYAVCIAESTMFALCEEIKARSLFATHLHDIYDIIHESEARRDMRQRMAFFCTQIADQGLNNDPSLQYAYRYKLEPGVNRNPEAFKVAAVAGYPNHLLKRAQSVYDGRVHR